MSTQKGALRRVMHSAGREGEEGKKKSGWKSLKVVFCVCVGKDAAEIFDQRWEGKYGCGRENFYSLKEPLIKL